jgi:hypothetical protein
VGEVREAVEAGPALGRQRRLRVVREQVVALGDPRRERARRVRLRAQAGVERVDPALVVEEVELVGGHPRI